MTEHLTENQLTEYFGNAALEGEMKHAIGRHLLLCDFCLKRLPQPTSEQFLAALMAENEVVDLHIEKTAFPTWLGIVAQLFTQQKILAWSVGALAAVLVFSVLIWLGSQKPSDKEREVTEVFEVKDIEPIPNQNGYNEINASQTFPISKSGNSISPANPNRIAGNRDLPFTKSDQPKQNSKITALNDSGTKIQERILNRAKTNISSTRGGAAKCGDPKTIETAVGTSEEKVVLKWGKIPNAAKYHLYVSDDEEILVDEYETEQETLYVVKKPLDPVKTYKWKIVVTLGNGQAIIGDVQKFTVKNLRSDQDSLKRKKKSEIRCSASN